VRPDSAISLNIRFRSKRKFLNCLSSPVKGLYIQLRLMGREQFLNGNLKFFLILRLSFYFESFLNPTQAYSDKAELFSLSTHLYVYLRKKSIKNDMYENRYWFIKFPHLTVALPH
jgi:hypothetical protein